jgi:hypothetical protein
MSTLVFNSELLVSLVRDIVRLSAAGARSDTALKLLELRFGPVTEATQNCVHRADEAQLHATIERALTAQTLDEALAPLR